MSSNPAAGQDQLRALLPVLDRVMGSEHAETLRAGILLAVFTATAGDATAARDQILRLLPVIERVRGREHPDTLRARLNLATASGLGAGGGRQGLQVGGGRAGRCGMCDEADPEAGHRVVVSVAVTMGRGVAPDAGRHGLLSGYRPLVPNDQPGQPQVVAVMERGVVQR